MSDISSISGSNAHIMQEVGMKVAAKAMDVARDQGESVHQLLDKAAEVQNKAHGGHGDVANVGGRVDVTG